MIQTILEFAKRFWILLLIAILSIVFFPPLSTVLFFIAPIAIFVKLIMDIVRGYFYKSDGLLTTALSSFAILIMAMSIGGICSVFGSFYPFVLPMVFSAPTFFSISFFLLLYPDFKGRMLLITVNHLGHGLLFFPYQYAIQKWPGGDDGSGMAWYLCIGFATIIASVCSAIIICLLVLKYFFGINVGRSPKGFFLP